MSWPRGHSLSRPDVNKKMFIRSQSIFPNICFDNSFTLGKDRRPPDCACSRQMCRRPRKHTGGLGNWEQPDQTKMWHWESILTTQSSNPSKDAWWKCLEAGLPSTNCRPGIWCAIVASSVHVDCRHTYLSGSIEPFNQCKKNKIKHCANIWNIFTSGEPLAHH